MPFLKEQAPISIFIMIGGFLVMSKTKDQRAPKPVKIVFTVLQAIKVSNQKEKYLM